MSTKYPGYNANDTAFDEHHRKSGQMTNREFFTSSGPGGFYEGMEWNEKTQEWVPDAASREKERIQDAKKCSECGCLQCACW